MRKARDVLVADRELLANRANQLDESAGGRAKCARPALSGGNFCLGRFVSACPARLTLIRIVYYYRWLAARRGPILAANQLKPKPTGGRRKQLELACVLPPVQCWSKSKRQQQR